MRIISTTGCPVCHSEQIAQETDQVMCPRCKRVIVKTKTGALSAKSVAPAVIRKGVTS